MGDEASQRLGIPDEENSHSDIDITEESHD